MNWMIKITLLCTCIYGCLQFKNIRQIEVLDVKPQLGSHIDSFILDKESLRIVNANSLGIQTLPNKFGWRKHIDFYKDKELILCNINLSSTKYYDSIYFKFRKEHLYSIIMFSDSESTNLWLQDLLNLKNNQFVQKYNNHRIYNNNKLEVLVSDMDSLYRVETFYLRNEKVLKIIR